MSVKQSQTSDLTDQDSVAINTLEATQNNASPTSESSHTSDSKTSAKDSSSAADVDTDARPKEYGGRDGLEPTRYGDWEVKGRCVDF